jgi:hypothetical protein
VEKVAEFVVAATQAECRLVALEPAHRAVAAFTSPAGK